MGLPNLSCLILQGLSVEPNFIPLLKISACIFVTGYGVERIGFSLYFNSKFNGSIFQVPSVPSNDSQIF